MPCSKSLCPSSAWQTNRTAWSLDIKLKSTINSRHRLRWRRFSRQVASSQFSVIRGGTLPLAARAAPEPEFMPRHVHFAAAEGYALAFQSKSLFHGRVSAELDLAACSEHPMPRQIDSCVEGPNHLPGSPGESGRARNRAVGRHFAPRNFTDTR